MRARKRRRKCASIEGQIPIHTRAKASRRWYSSIAVTPLRLLSQETGKPITRLVHRVVRDLLERRPTDVAIGECRMMPGVRSNISDR